MAAMLVSAGTALAIEPTAGKNAAAPVQSIAAKVLALTGAQTRIVWLRNKRWQTDKSSVDGGVGCSIMAFDTEGKGERELAPEGELYDPLISPSGRHMIYTAKTEGKLRMHCVDWNGANSRALGEFPHPATGMFYLRTGQLDRKDYRAGCNTYISPDNSYFVTIMAGSHDLVTLYKPDGSSRDVGLIPPGLRPVTDVRKG
ncbi:MAG: hypothetical protein WCQ77_16760 [Planctomycetota bacterium]